MTSDEAVKQLVQALGKPGLIPALYDPAISIRLVEVAKKYAGKDGKPVLATLEYTTPGGPNSYHLSDISTAWTQGFFPGLLWLLVERARLAPDSIAPQYSEEAIITLARQYEIGFESLKRPSINHDQGFRFQLSYGRDFLITGSESAKAVLLEASESLMDRFSEKAGCIRSWDQKITIDQPDKYTTRNMDQHYLVIIDNMMNLDMLYEATQLTGDPKYAHAANLQAEKSMTTHVRSDGTTFHVVNMDQNTGKPLEFMTHQGYSDDSVWSRGQAWGIYGYAQCALRTGREDFLETSRKLADVFLSLLPSSGVPPWDFKAPAPCPYDASAGTIAARGFQMLHQLLRTKDKAAAEMYLKRANQLVLDILRECGNPPAQMRKDHVDYGSGGWETILKHSTINGNEAAVNRLMDHGLVYADYYLVEFANEALKLAV